MCPSIVTPIIILSSVGVHNIIGALLSIKQSFKDLIIINIENNFVKKKMKKKKRIIKLMEKKQKKQEKKNRKKIKK